MSGACSQAASLASGVRGPALSHADPVPYASPHTHTHLQHTHARTPAAVASSRITFPLLSSLLFRSPEPPISSAAQRQNQRCAFQGIFCVHIGAGSLPLPSSLLIYRCDAPCRASGSRRAKRASRPMYACEPAPRMLPKLYLHTHTPPTPPLCKLP